MALVFRPFPHTTRILYEYWFCFVYYIVSFITLTASCVAEDGMKNDALIPDEWITFPGFIVANSSKVYMYKYTYLYTVNAKQRSDILAT